MRSTSHLVAFHLAIYMAMSSLTCGTQHALHTVDYNSSVSGLIFSPQQVRLAELRTAGLLANFTQQDTTMTCEADMHKSITPCRQYCNEWCWAATGTMLWNFYQRSDACDNECKFVSNFFSNGQSSTLCCPANPKGCVGTEREQQSRCNHGVSQWDSMAQMQHDLNGQRTFVGEANAGPMDQSTLDATLTAGNPVQVGFSFQGGGHALFIGGCSGGKYWVHDPWAFDGLPENNWKAYSYSELLQFNLGGRPCTWTAHVYSTDPGPMPAPAPPTPPSRPPATPTPPPAPPTPTSCVPQALGKCSVCDSCCKSYLVSPTDCAECVKQECQAKTNVCNSDSSCNTCTACCKSYLQSQADCDGCVGEECPALIFRPA